MKIADVGNLKSQKGLFFFHGNKNGSGSAIRFCVEPGDHGHFGYLSIFLAPQMTVSELGHHRFDWDNFEFSFLIDVDETAKILQVLRGETESINEGIGVDVDFYLNKKHLTFAHILAPITGYMMKVRYADEEGDNKYCDFLFSSSEALALCEILSRSLYTMTMGK